MNMKNSAFKKFEEQATIYITLAMMLSLSANFISDYVAIPWLEYLMIGVSILFIALGVIKVNQYEKHQVNKNCNS